MPVELFLKATGGSSSPVVLGLFKQVLRSLALAVEEGPWVAGGSMDPLQQPLPEGPHRLRNLAPTLKESVAEAASKGEVARSGSRVMRLLGRFGRKAAGRNSRANQYVWARLS
eukprot:10469173-Lingulodinium_polyedra.AAC.1